ncbi:MAG: pantetheine-phosphate adenylyltransferase [Chloroflexi bacterium]|nr:pantetheine-phosphate adenylyltransferase [Chloroflexota bacterium]
MRHAIYPGTFDPITLGHLDVVVRALGLFDRVTVAVLVNPRKQPSMDLATRLGIIRESLDEELGDAGRGVAVESFEGLTVDLARRLGAGAIVRGLRAVSDFESEIQMAQLNRRLAPEVETVFLMTSAEHAALSSTMVREIASFGGDVRGMVPAAVLRRLTVPGEG